MVIPHSKAISHALLTRAPLVPKDAFDLHVLGLPPAFVLSQDQTLMLILTDRNILAKRFASHPDLDPEGRRSGASQDALAICSIPLGRTAACASLPFVHDVKEQGARSSRIPSRWSAALFRTARPAGEAVI